MNFDRAVDEALQNPKYSTVLDDLDVIIENILRSIADFIAGLLQIDVSDADLSFFQYSTNALLAIALIVITVVLAIAAIIIIRAIRKRKKTSALGMEEFFNMLDDKSISTLDLIKESDKAAAEGDFRNAVRYRYICLLWITNKNLVPISSSKVNSRILRDINRLFPSLSAGFQEVVGVFNYAWFGNKSLDDPSYSSFSLAFNSLLKEVSAYEKAQD